MPIAQDSLIALVLTDANMPEVDGFSLAGAIKADVALE